MTRSQLAVMTALITAFLLPSPMQPQSVPDFKAQQIFAAEKSEVAVTETLPALLDGVSIEAGQSNGKATFNLHKAIDSLNFIATVSAPLNKDPQPTDLASLNGLAADFSVSASLAGFVFPQPNLTKQDMICAGLNVAKDECDSTGIERAVALACGLDVKGVKESEVESQVEQKLSIATSSQRACFESTYPGAQRTFLAASVGSVHSWAVTGEVGHKVASFFRENGMKGKETNLPYAVSGAYGRIGSTSVYSLRGRYEARYTDGKAATRCQPVASADSAAGLASCDQLPFGAPTRSHAFTASAEARWYFTKFAVSPVVAYDFQKKVLGVQLPIYLVRNSDGQFTGGFRLGWRDDTHVLSASVFISKPLSVGN